MPDLIPDNSNKIAYALGYIFHPFVLGVVGIAAVLSQEKLTFSEAASWLITLSLILIVPLVSMIQYLKRQEKYTYQRHSRTPFYLTGWLAMLTCMGLVIWRDLPQLAACFASLLLWVPLQVIINRTWTKVSAHSAVSVGFTLGLGWLGIIHTPWLYAGAAALVLLTAWARIMTRNHTLIQVVLGWIVAALSILLTFPLFL